MHIDFQLRHVPKDRLIFIWGTGKAGRELLTTIKDLGLQVDGFIDSDTLKCTATNIEGYNTFSPDFLLKYKTEKKPYVFIGSMYRSEIAECLESMDYHAGIDYYEDGWYYFIEKDVPGELVENQSYKPKISILMSLKGIATRGEIILEAINSIISQSYKNWDLCIAVSDGEYSDFLKLTSNINMQNAKHIICVDNLCKIDMLSQAFAISEGEYVTILEQEDLLSKNALFYIIEELNKNKSLKILYTDEDRFFLQGEFFSPFYKEDISLNERYISKCLLRGSYFHKDLVKNFGFFEESITKILRHEEPKNIKYIGEVTYHYRAIENVWPETDKKIKVIAYYLTQFHTIPENDEWWGKGFTEWTNTKKAKPLFEGHYQPRIPGELGYYDLVEDKDIQRKQIQLAKEYGIHGFCYYYYWFSGKRLLEKPLDNFLKDKSLDFPFCLFWANESWSRRWDGKNQEILLEQIYEENFAQRFIEDTIPILKDERYISINGAPLLIIYRIKLLPDPLRTIQIWREICRKNGIEKIHVSIINYNKIKTLPIEYGADSMVDFPPLTATNKDIANSVHHLTEGFAGNIYDYEAIVKSFIKMEEKYKRFCGCALQWDNTARREKSAKIFHNFTIEGYKEWLLRCSDYARTFNDEGEQLVFVNAWNEWAEGAYLEPDEKYGRKLLEVTREVLAYR